MSTPVPPAFVLNVKASLAFLARLDPDAKTFTFQTFTDGIKPPGPDPLSRIIHGSLDHCWSTLAELNRAGAGIFVTVNESSGKGRKKADINRCRAIWQELDHEFTGKVPLEPHMVVQTSPGKLHHYYLVDQCPINQWGNVQQRMVQEYGSDPAASDISRVLRVPGFWHCKCTGGAPPHLVQLLKIRQRAPYSWAQILEAFPPVENASKSYQDTEDPRVMALQALDLYRQEKGPGRHELWCPFATQHTNPEDRQGAIYLAAHHQGIPVPVFRCMHTSCRERTIGDLDAYLTEYNTDFARAAIGSLFEGTQAEADTLQDRVQALDPKDHEGLLQLLREYIVPLPDAGMVERTLKALKERTGLSLGALRAMIADARELMRIQQSGVVQWPNFPRLDAAGAPLAHEDNVRALCSHYGITLRRNRMSHEVEVLIPGRSFTQADQSNETRVVMRDLAVFHGMDYRRMDEHVLLLAGQNQYHPFLTYLQSCEWDQKHRLDLLCKTVQVDPENQKICDLIMKRWLISIVAAVKGYSNKPLPRGVLVFTGKQQIGKTSWLRYLFPPGCFREGFHLDPSNKDSIIEATKYLCIELGELDATFRRVDISRLKAFIGKPFDEVRVPFDHAASRWPRCTIYAGTVNHEQFLQDQTGNTRFWPIATTGFDLDSVQLLSESGKLLQLWKEVEYLYDQGEPWWMSSEEMKWVEEQSEQYRQPSVIEDLLLDTFDWGQPLETYLTLKEIANCMGMRNLKGGDFPQLRMALAKLTGRARAFMKKREGKASRVWHVPPIKQHEQLFPFLD